MIDARTNIEFGNSTREGIKLHFHIVKAFISEFESLY